MELTGPQSIVARKGALRLQLRRRRQTLRNDERRAHSEHICEHLWSWVCAHTPPNKALALFAAHNFEPNVDEVARRWLEKGGALVLPRVVGTKEGARLQFVGVCDLAALKPSALGLREVWGPEAHVVDVAALGAVVVPCLAVDDQGMRLGSGMGLYDRAFWRQRLPLVGITFAQQRVASVPSEPHDMRVASCITEAGLTEF